MCTENSAKEIFKFVRTQNRAKKNLICTYTKLIKLYIHKKSVQKTLICTYTKLVPRKLEYVSVDKIMPRNF